MSKEEQGGNKYEKIRYFVDGLAGLAMLNRSFRKEDLIERQKAKDDLRALAKELGGVAEIETWIKDNKSDLIPPSQWGDLSWLNENN